MHDHEYNTDVYFAIGKQLYRYDSANPDFPVVLHYTFPSNITVINGGPYRCRAAAVGLENGQMYIMNTVDAKQIQDDKKKVLYVITPEEGAEIGTIIDIASKQGNSGFQ